MQSDATSTEHHRRVFFRFDPAVQSGTLLQILVILAACVAGYGTYSADKAKDRAEVTQIKVDAEQRKTEINEKLSDLRRDAKDIQTALTEVKTSLAVLNATAARKDDEKRAQR